MQNQNDLNLCLWATTTKGSASSVLALVAIGADVNSYGYDNSLENAGIEISCYYLDLLVYLDLFELYISIGTERFNYEIYNVDADNNATNKIRLFWAAKFCSWIIRHKNIEFLKNLMRNTNATIPENKSHYNTARMIDDFTVACLCPDLQAWHYKRQLQTDLNINFPLAPILHLFLYDRILNNNFAVIMSTDASEEVQRILWFTTNMPCSLRRIIFNPIMLLLYAVAISSIAVVLSRQENLEEDVKFGLFVTQATLSLPILYALLKLSHALIISISNCRQIEVFGDIPEIALRAYINKQLLDVVKNQSMPHYIENSSNSCYSRTRRCNFLGYLFSRAPAASSQMIDAPQTQHTEVLLRPTV